MKYADLIKEHKALKVLEKKPSTTAMPHSSEFWGAHDAFKVHLRDALKDDEFVPDLYADHLLRFISWCSTYRPYEPHTILTMLSSHSGIE